MELKLKKYTVNFKEDLTWKDIYSLQAIIVREQKEDKGIHSDSGLDIDTFFELIRKLSEGFISNIEKEVVDGDNISLKVITNKSEIEDIIISPKETEEEEMTQIVITGINYLKKK